MSISKFVVRDARPADFGAIHRMICDLATYENMRVQVSISADRLREDAFPHLKANFEQNQNPKKSRPLFEAIVVERQTGRARSTTTFTTATKQPKEQSEIVAYCIFNRTYSFELQSPTLWMEDLFVSEAYRSRGLASAIIRKLISIAVRDQLGAIEWNVLGWNRLAIEFYHKLGARSFSDGETGRHLFRLPAFNYAKLM